MVQYLPAAHENPTFLGLRCILARRKNRYFTEDEIVGIPHVLKIDE